MRYTIYSEMEAISIHVIIVCITYTVNANPEIVRLALRSLSQICSEPRLSAADMTSQALVRRDEHTVGQTEPPESKKDSADQLIQAEPL